MILSFPTTSLSLSLSILFDPFSSLFLYVGATIN